jgi:CRP/FNR family transcriptional regulator, anaerobic regulatory protein
MQTATVMQMPARSAPRPVRAHAPQSRREVKCSTCNLRELCLPAGLSEEELKRVEKVVNLRRRLKRGEVLFTAGDAFHSIFAIRSGFFKTSVVDSEGREQVTGFSMGGELLGLDGLGRGQYNGTAVALEDCEVCVMPFAMIEEISRDVRGMQRHLHSVLAREIVRDHGVMMLLGSMCAEERLATFLLNLSRRLERRGFSQSEFHLRMTREEIGSYLGLKLETVSRIFSRFQEEGLVEVQQKHVRIVDIDGLQRVLKTR